MESYISTITKILNEEMIILGVFTVITFGLLIAIVLWLHAMFRLGRERREVAQLRRNPERLQTLETAYKTLSGRTDYEVYPAMHRVLDVGYLDTEAIDFPEWIHWPRYLAGIFVFIGLLGTVGGMALASAGLATTVTSTAVLNDKNSAGSGEQNLSPVHSNASNTSSGEDMEKHLQDVLDGIAKVLKGIKSASFCTLYGLFATLFVSALNSLYLARSRRVLTEIAEITNKTLIPLRRGAQQILTPREIEARILTATNKLDVSSSGLVGAAKKIETSAGELIGGVEPLRGAIAELVGRAVILTTSMSTAVKDMQMEMTQVKKTHNDLLKQSQKAHGDLVQQSQQAENLLQDGFQKLSEIAGMLKTTDASIMGATIINAADSMKGSVQQLRDDLADAQKKAEQTQERVLNGADETQKALRDILQRLERSLLDVTETAAQTGLSNKLEQLQREMQLHTVELRKSGAAAAQERVHESSRAPSAPLRAQGPPPQVPALIAQSPVIQARQPIVEKQEPTGSTSTGTYLSAQGIVPEKSRPETAELERPKASRWRQFLNLFPGLRK